MLRDLWAVLTDRISLRAFELLRQERDHFQRLASEQGRECEVYRRVLDAGLGKILAKVDPLYAQSEFDPARREASDAIGRQVIEKLLGEDRAQQHNHSDIGARMDALGKNMVRR